MADRFYTNSALAPGLFSLAGPEAHHLATVRRFHAGDQVVLFNGDGHEYPAEVAAVGRKSIELMVLRIDTIDRELPFRLQVAAPLPKGDRGDVLVEKLTELGATDFFPLRTQRSVVDPRAAKLEKLRRVVIEASKQCGRNVLMSIHPLTAWPDHCRRRDLPERRFLAHTGADQALTRGTGDAACLAVGPEGGFTEAEVELGRAAGWQMVTLGPRVLRVETACLALASLFSLGAY